ncbi:HK97 family phage major capsid protein [Novosphingobium chloroacetimidivorans]|uniref:HK97 family phage major capsid protein n=1 Tax=Novosphingobium chloroacetimidivorans TaxID=1428314 RepID=A0A7W7K8L8_9SPHN|nr:phage major capsid protein [Novosphingobium chloroacetimidivorans]MBB4858267.1 HK97 family phage major capsid protein [Novosphingobium chloroacetimidivorans]
MTTETKTAPELAAEAKALFDAKIDEVKGIATDLQGRMAKGEDLTKSAKELADQAITGMNEAKARVDELEQKLARRGSDDGALEVKSYGAQLAESEQLKGYIDRGAQGSMRIELKAITSASGSAGGLIVSQRDPGITDMPKRPDVILRDLVTVVPTTSASIDFAKQTVRTNAAAPVAEGNTKPYSNYGWSRVSTPVRTLAHLAKLTRQAMDDAPQLQGEIDSEMRYGLALAEDAQILLGDGTGENLLGMMPQATPYALPTGATTPTTSIDKLRAGVLQATLALYSPTAFVLNPIDWYNIELTKDAANGYIFANPLQMAGPILWGRPVAATVSMAAGSWLTGDFKRAATLYDRMTVEVLISSENADDFEKNLFTMRAEERLAMAVKRPAALVKGTF